MTTVRSGWPTFAGVMASVVGAYNAISGIAAISEDDTTEAINEVLFDVSITAWGWFWLIVGIAQLVTAWLIFQRHVLGQLLGITFAAISAFFTVFLIFVAPIWALTVLLIDILVLYGLTAGWDEYDVRETTV